MLLTSLQVFLFCSSVLCRLKLARESYHGSLLCLLCVEFSLLMLFGKNQVSEAQNPWRGGFNGQGLRSNACQPASGAEVRNTGSRAPRSRICKCFFEFDTVCIFMVAGLVCFCFVLFFIIMGKLTAKLFQISVNLEYGTFSFFFFFFKLARTPAVFFLALEEIRLLHLLTRSVCVWLGVLGVCFVCVVCVLRGVILHNGCATAFRLMSCGNCRETWILVFSLSFLSSNFSVL